MMGLVMLFYSSLGDCQPHKKNIKDVINNKTLSYKIIKTPVTLLDSNKTQFPQTFIQLSLTKDEESEMHKLTSKDWRMLLSNNKSDWAANICLYHIFNKDASNFDIFKTEQEWRKFYKKDDVLFWENQFALKTK